MTTIARLESERKLGQAEHRYRLLAEQIAAVVYIESADKAGSITYISPQIEQLTGYTPSEIISPNLIWSKVIHPEDKKRVIKKEKECLKNEGRFS